MIRNYSARVAMNNERNDYINGEDTISLPRSRLILTHFYTTVRPTL